MQCFSSTFLQCLFVFYHVKFAPTSNKNEEITTKNTAPKSRLAYPYFDRKAKCTLTWIVVISLAFFLAVSLQVQFCSHFLKEGELYPLSYWLKWCRSFLNFSVFCFTYSSLAIILLYL